MAFGTGALKLTPAHDVTDFEIAGRVGAEPINILNEDATLNENAGPFAGMDRYAARKAVLEALRAIDAVGEEERPFVHAVGHCSRCHTQVEPWLSEQWFVKVEPLARPAIDAVRSGQTRFVPARYERMYSDWMENLRDWCISRQLWWGHRIPVWTCANGHQAAYHEDPARCAACDSTQLEQDPDVLDTWFSSALWPFSTLGWPDDTPDLRTWYPTSVLVTGYDIITFWVSRMMMMGIHFLGKPPFADVFIHGMVRDVKGKKMSKSFGNAMDPLEMVDRYGADALRMTLVRGATLERDVPLDEKWIEGDRNFCNKLWNISRFVLMNLDATAEDLPAPEHRTLADRWILSRVDAVTEEVDAAMEGYDFSRAANTLRQFTWSEFADWYVEWSKGRLYDGTEADTRDQSTILAYVLERLLRLLHPVIPFITEELWRALTGRDATVAAQPWPVPAGHRDEAAEREMALLQDAIAALRRFRADHDIAPSVRPDAFVAGDEETTMLLDAEREHVRALAQWGDLRLEPPPDTGQYARLVIGTAVISVPLAGLLDIDAERARLGAQIQTHAGEAAAIERKLADDRFTANAPADVVQTQRDRLAAEHDRISRLESALRDLG
jgi:valyl-tRNA synthetase